MTLLIISYALFQCHKPSIQLAPIKVSYREDKCSFNSNNAKSVSSSNEMRDGMFWQCNKRCLVVIITYCQLCRWLATASIMVKLGAAFRQACVNIFLVSSCFSEN